jgi:hypothetical protein
LELDEHHVRGVVVDVFAGLYHVVVAANATVEAGPGVFDCDEQQVLRVMVDVVEQLGPVVAAVVGADVDVLHQEVVLVVAFLARVVHRVLLGIVVDIVEVLDRVVVVVVVAAVDGLLGEIASRSQPRLSVVGPKRDLVLMGERLKVRVPLPLRMFLSGRFGGWKLKIIVQLLTRSFSWFCRWFFGWRFWFEAFGLRLGLT